MQTITIRKPDDFHLHLRDQEYLPYTVAYSCHYGKAVVMPNLKPPITSIRMAKEYRERILKYVPSHCDFQPLMTLYLNSQLLKKEIAEMKNFSWLLGIKLYPSGVTTHSEAGVKKIQDFYHYFELMEKYDIPLMVHAEVSDPSVDFFDREKIFIERHLIKIREKFPDLKITLEHVSTREGVDFVNFYPNTAATVTPQHLLLTRNDLFSGGLQPHHFCLPVVKTNQDRFAIQQQVLKGNPRFFAGTDSAPHPKSRKECSYVAAGIFSAPISIALYISFFEQKRSLKRSLIENFLSKFGSDFYGLNYNSTTITLIKQENQIPMEYPLAKEQVIPMWFGKKINWKIKVESINGF